MADQKEPEVVFMRCTRGSDPRTANQKCGGRRAYKLSRDGSSAPMFKCATCGHTWVTPLGGQFAH